DIGQRNGEPPAAVERVLQVQCIELLHQVLVIVGNWVRPVVHRGTCDIECRTLACDRQRMIGIDHRPSRFESKRANPRSKKSFSMLNSPILACSAAMRASALSLLWPLSNMSVAPSNSWRFHCVI